MAVVRLSMDPTLIVVVGAAIEAAVVTTGAELPAGAATEAVAVTGAEAAAEAPETGPDISDTRLLWEPELHRL